MYARAPDWADTIVGPMRDPGLTARQAFMHALDHTPLWLKAAMAVRNLVVAPFGLTRRLEGKGHFLTRMPVVADTPDHFETGMPDRHLTFTLSTHRLRDHIGVTTNVWFNSWLGRIYLRLVMPGHILATRQIAARVADPISRHHGAFSERLVP